jgi:hypothetical protein
MKTYGSISTILISAILLALALAAEPVSSLAQYPCESTTSTSSSQSPSVNMPPPALPTYEQPPAPAPNYQWSPGYWGYGNYGYYWVPGVWVAPPAVGLYWTPGYWSYAPTGYVWIAGYWGPSVGFYGGINYGFGYFGVGFVGGYWSGGTFNYNTAVANVNKTVIRNVYADPGTISRHTLTRSHVSFNGAHGGISAKPTSGQISAAHRRVSGATPAQSRHVANARANSNNLVAFNHGKPAPTSRHRTSGTVRGQTAASHAHVASRSTVSSGSHWSHAAGTSHGTTRASGYHRSSDGYRGYQGGFRGYPGGFRGYPGGFRGSPGGFRGPSGGFRGSPGGSFRGGGRP